MSAHEVWLLAVEFVRAVECATYLQICKTVVKDVVEIAAKCLPLLTVKPFSIHAVLVVGRMFYSRLS